MKKEKKALLRILIPNWLNDKYETLKYYYNNDDDDYMVKINK